MQALFLFVITTLLLPAFTVNAQAANAIESGDLQPAKLLTMAGLNYLGGFVAQERRLANQFTISYGVGLHYSFYDNNVDAPIFGTRFINTPDKLFGRPYTTQEVTPYLLFEARSYNLARRVSRGRTIRGNSANYLALIGEIVHYHGPHGRHH